MDRLRGLNFGGWLSQVDAIAEKDGAGFPGVNAHLDTFIGRDDFARQKAWGFNHVRLPVDAYHFFTGEEAPVEPRFAVLDRAVRWAAESGLQLVIDLHECPGHDFADAVDDPVQKLFVDPVYLRKTETIWSVIAERYSGEKHVCFEVLNEPVAPDAAVWNRIKDALCRTVRKFAPHNTIIVGSNMWNGPATYREFTPVAIDNVCYCFHFYEPLLFTHQHAPWIHEPEIRAEYTYPADYGPGFTRKYGFVHSAGRWDRSRIAEEIEPVVRFREKYDVPVVCNEFGVYAPVPVNLQLLWLEDVLSLLQELDIGYSYWNYKNLDFGIISRGEQLHAHRPQYANPERINHQVLGVLQKY
jgi:aryl-phospho-beta-D-glucosidase BglC (GH1 family)